MKQANLKRVIAVSLLILTIYGAGVSAGSRQSVDFKRDIEPIFASQCYQCHGPKMALGQLRLDSKKLAMQGGISGGPIKAGQSGTSLLVQRILGLDGQPRMPMGAKPLSDSQIALIRTWIDQGAIWPADVSTDEPAIKRHWAYIKPVHLPVPSVTRPQRAGTRGGAGPSGRRQPVGRRGGDDRGGGLSHGRGFRGRHAPVSPA